MSYVTVLVHVASDSTHAWVTRESAVSAAFISFWYNPNSVMTMGDVVDTIESEFGHFRIDRITV